MAKAQTTPQSEEAKAEPDPFNIESLRLPPSFAETAGVKKVWNVIQVRKPHRQEWIRVHPSENYRGDFATIHLKEEGEFYLVAPTIVGQLDGELTPVTIYTAINKSGEVFLWPARLPGSASNRRTAVWYSSAHEAAELAMKRLTRVKANMSLGAYEIAYSDNPMAPENDPAWPDLSFIEMLRIGFKKTGCFVETFEHPVIKALRGL
jgi:hypothetical protein